MSHSNGISCKQNASTQIPNKDAFRLESIAAANIQPLAYYELTLPHSLGCCMCLLGKFCISIGTYYTR